MKTNDSYLFSSARLKFRPLHQNDLGHFFEMESDPEVLKYYRRDVVKNIKEAEENLKKYLSYASEHVGLGAFAVTTIDTEEFIGIGILIHLNKDPSQKDYEIGYRLIKKYWGNGFATEIAQSLIKYASSILNISHLYGSTHPDSIVSQKVLMKTGFTYLRDEVLHGGVCKVFRLPLLNI